MNAIELRPLVFAELRKIAPELEEGDVAPGELLRDQVDLDSMDWLNFLIAVHQRFEVEIAGSGLRDARHAGPHRRVRRGPGPGGVGAGAQFAPFLTGGNKLPGGAGLRYGCGAMCCKRPVRRLEVTPPRPR